MAQDRDAQAAQFNSVCGVSTITASNVTYVEDLGNWTCCVQSAGKDLWTGLPVCTDQQTIDAWSSVPCNVSTSPLNWKAHAYVTAVGFSCACTVGYGEYYDPQTKETTCELCTRDDVCCGIKLNTNVPFIGNCLETKDKNPQSHLTEENAFPTLMGSLSQILVTAILIISFVLIIIGGIMIATGNPSGGKKLIMKVVVGIALLGASGVILRLINPNFFG